MKDAREWSGRGWRKKLSNKGKRENTNGSEYGIASYTSVYISCPKFKGRARSGCEQ